MAVLIRWLNVAGCVQIIIIIMMMIIIIIMYIYHALINALSAHMIHQY